MGFTVYQCCFTNTGHDIGSQAQVGWHDVAVSSGIPYPAHDFCVRAQNAVASNPARKRGGVKSLYEILCDGAYVYAIRSAFNVTDNLGRPIIFSHAYIFLAREVMSNPDAFLSLSLDNFKTSEKDALQWDGRYDSLIRDKEMTLEAARKIAGVNSPEVYQSLTYCAYAQMAHHGKPLFLRYKAPEETLSESDVNQRMRALLLCVWSGLPFFLRRKFSAVSAPELGGQDFHIILTKSRNPRPDLWTPGGITQNPGIVTPQTQSRIKRYFYLEYAQKLAENPGELSVYYAWLDRNAAEWGDAANEAVLKLLAQQYQYKPVGVDYAKNPVLKCVPTSFPNAELADWLSDAEKAPSPGSADIRNCLKRMRDEYEMRRTKRKPSQSKEEAQRKWDEAKREARRKKEEAEREARRKREEAKRETRRKREEAKRNAQTQPDTAQTGQAHTTPDKGTLSPQSIDFETFSFDYIDSYLQISERIVHPNAKWFRGFAELARNCVDTEFGNEDGEQWSEVNAFFAKHPGFPMDAPEKLSKYLYSNGSKSHTLPWYQSWTKLMVALGPISDIEADIRDGLISIYVALSTPDCQILCKSVPPMLRRLQKRTPYGGAIGASKTCRDFFAEVLKSACMELDKTLHNGAPLDMWLLLGEARYGRSLCFDVFNKPPQMSSGDGANAKILSVSPQTAINKSYLLRIPPYKEEYAAYLTKHFKNISPQDGHKRTVALWLKELGTQRVR